jgi:hypothetical protein
LARHPKTHLRPRFFLEPANIGEQNGQPSEAGEGPPGRVAFVEAEDVETEPNVLVALLAIRTLGGRSVPASHVVVKALKAPIKHAVEQGLLREDTLTEQVPVEGKKKPKTVKTKVVGLTEAGERALRASGDPEVLAAAQARMVAAEVEALRRGLDADRAALRQEVQAALAGPGKDKGQDKFQAEVGKLAKALEALTEKVRQLQERQPKGGTGAETLMAKIDEGFDSLGAKLERALQGLPKPAAQRPSTPASPAANATPPARPETPAQKPPDSQSLQAVLRKAYDELKAHYREYQEGMVELPRLYHEARRVRPGLTVEEFQRELVALESRRVLDLHIRNEVRDAPEADKAIRRNDKLYYFVYWPHA